jgi:hypothetical protein
LHGRFSGEEIHSANGKIMMNAASLELPESGYGRGAGLFPIYAMMNTSCRLVLNMVVIKALYQ